MAALLWFSLSDGLSQSELPPLFLLALPLVLFLSLFKSGNFISWSSLGVDVCVCENAGLYFSFFQNSLPLK